MPRSMQVVQVLNADAFVFNYRGGSRGRVQGVRTPPEMTCGFLIQLVFCKKNKKLCGLLVLKYSKRRVHPLLKKILDPPLK